MTSADHEVVIRPHSNYVGIRFYNSEYGKDGKLDYFSVVITSPNLNANARIYAYQGEQELLQMFEFMSKSWKGWSGEKTWKSLEQELSLSCSSDSLGHIEIEIKLRDPLFIKGWQLQGVALVESGQLESLYKNIKQFIIRGW